MHLKISKKKVQFGLVLPGTWIYVCNVLKAVFPYWFKAIVN